MELLAKLPSQLRNDDDVLLARKILDDVHKYEFKLIRILDAHRSSKYRQKLLQCHIDEISDWEIQVDALFDKLEALMKVIYDDVPKLQRILGNRRTRQNEINSNDWANKVGDMSMGMVMTGLHYDEKEMERFRQIEIIEKEHLLELVGELEEAEAILK